jgi:hypothetical protein
MIHAEVTIFCHDDKAMSVQILWGDRAILYTYDYNHVFSSRGPLDQTSPRKLAKSTGRTRSFLAAEAISAYLETNE